MSFTFEDQTRLSALCDSQITALKKHAEEVKRVPRLILSGIPALGIKFDPFDSSWLYVDPLERDSVNPIKIHIPLKNWRDNGLLLANVIKQNSASAIAGIKTVNPLLTEEDLDSLFCRQRIEKSTPITIYFVESAQPCEIAGAIYTINHLMSEIDRIQPINSFDSAASDLGLGFCSITIHGKQPQEYIDGRTAEGILARRALIQDSEQIKDIVQILTLFDKIDDYIKDRDSKGEFTSCWGSLFSAFGSYTKDRKITAAQKLKTAIIENKTLDEYYHGPLKQGNLGKLFKECKQILPFLDKQSEYERIETQLGSR